MLISILVFVVVLSVLVLVHELGHFIMARRAGVWVEEFGFGLPPRLIGKKIGETIYSINVFPFGGFVRLHGEQDEEGITNKSRAFLYRSKRTRASIVVAGVVMNFILAVLAFAAVYSFSGIPRDTHKLRVVGVASGSPAQTAGVIVGDVITKVGKDSVTSVGSFVSKVNSKRGVNVDFEIERALSGQTSVIRLQMKPRENPPQGEGPLGVTITTTEIYFPPLWQRPFYGIYYGTKESFVWVGDVFRGLTGIAKEASQGKVPSQVSGPVGIFALVYEIIKTGDVKILVNFIGIISINLAVLNILPIPALDGGRLLFIGIESVVGKKVVPKVEATIHTIGIIILLLLILAITVGDIRRLILAGGIDGFVKSVTK